MKINKLFLLFLFLLAHTGVKAQGRTIEVTTKINELKKGVDFNYTKTGYGNYVVLIKLNDAVNVYPTEYKCLADGVSGTLLTLQSSDNSQYPRFTSYSTYYVRGVLNSKVDPNFVYALPFPKGHEISISYLSNLYSKYFNNDKAKKFKAFSFESDKTDSVCAIRKGTVINICDKYEMDTMLQKSYTSSVNHVLIEHADGTIANYSGFKKGAIWVKEGQTVYPYTPLGKLAHYDQRKKFNLRLSVYSYLDIDSIIQNREIKTFKNFKPNCSYIDPLFITSKGACSLKNNVKYESVFNDYVLDHELSNGEMKKLGIKKHALKNFDIFQIESILAESIVKDTVYFDINNRETTDKKKAVSYAVKWDNPQDEHKRHFQTFYMSGKIKSEGSYVNQPDTLPAGKCYWYYMDSKTNDRWMMHGKWTEWYENGQLKRDQNHRNGNFSGKLVTYWENGQVKRTNVDKDGKFMKDKCFDSAGNEVPTYPYAKAGNFGSGKQSIDNYLANEFSYDPIITDKKNTPNTKLDINVDTLGNVVDVKIVAGTDSILDTKLKELILKMPKWTPAIIDGERYSFNREYVYYYKYLPKNIYGPSNSVGELAYDPMLYCINQDTIFYNKARQLVKTIHEADVYEILTADTKDSTLVIERLFYKSGKKKSEKYFKKQLLSKDISDLELQNYKSMKISIFDQNVLLRIPVGKYKEWYENGQLSKEIINLSNEHSSIIKMYWPNGNYRRDDEIKEGKRIKANCYDLFNRSTTYFLSDCPSFYPGGEEKMQRFISEKLIYPMEAMKTKTQGKVDVNVHIDSAGRIVCMNCTNNKEIVLVNEAFRVIRLMPRWLPAFKLGEPIASIQTVSVSFVLNESNK